MPKKINLDKTSVEKILGNCQEVMVYGLRICRYYSVMDALQALNIKVNSWTKTGFPIINYDKLAFDINNKDDWQKIETSCGREYKAILASLMIENYHRLQQNQPIIPLIFCVGIEELGRVVNLNSEKVAKSHLDRDIHNFDNPNNTSITEKELRRLYKLYAESCPEIEAITQLTIHFVKVKQSSQDPRLYTLEPLQAFWDQAWQQLWRERKQSHLPVLFPKQYHWRDILAASIFKPIDKAGSKDTENIPPLLPQLITR